MSTAVALRAKRHAAHRPDRLALDAGEQYRFGFNMTTCVGCHSCEVACAEQNGLPDGTSWRRVGEIEGGDHPNTKRFNVSMACNHCLEPACLLGCPTNAYEKLSTGIVIHHADDCVGCQYCTWNCPYSVPVFQPDRRIVTKCDMCRPRMEQGFEPACVASCPTKAITVEKVDVAAWRADHAQADAPSIPSSSITISTTRFTLPELLPDDLFAVSDWNIRPEDPHWPLIWLTLLSQLAVGVSATAHDTRDRIIAAVLAGLSLVGALFHLGRPVVAYKALRNVRRSWLSREVLLLSLYAGAALGAVAVPAIEIGAVLFGALGILASAKLYIVPGRPAWNTRLTIVRFFATTAALGPIVTGRYGVAVLGLLCSIGATVANWTRLRASREVALRGAFRLETDWFARATTARLTLGVIAALFCATTTPSLGATGQGPVPSTATVVHTIVAFCVAACAETIGRWLFYVAVVPLNMPGSFWRHTVANNR